MADISGYRMAGGITAQDLVESVKEFLDQGWQPYGSPFATPKADEQGLSVFQAMVRYEKSIETVTDV